MSNYYYFCEAFDIQCTLNQILKEVKYVSTVLTSTLFVLLHRIKPLTFNVHVYIEKMSVKFEAKNAAELKNKTNNI